MASTYSPLKIELITTGEQSATWGTTTNVNLGTAIEEAITGSADVTFASADVTLTLTNTNGTQTARNLCLRLTGTTGGARSLIVPAIEKQYIVKNDTADTITIKNTTGTGVAIPTTMTAIVYNNGTNIASASIYSTSLVTPLLAATDASFVNALPVTSGGTGVTTSTGTGSVVRATSPTLVTPLLGTPTSGVLTNATGLPLTTGVTGTLGVSNGGTGVTTSTGTGDTVLSTSPTLVTPALGTPSALVGTNITGTAAGLSIGGNLTAAAPTAATAAPGTNTTQIATTAFVTNVSSTLGTMSTQNATTVAITGGTVNNVTTTGSSVASATGLGYLGIPQNGQGAGYTLALGDAGKHVYYTGGAATITVPTNASVALPVGVAITIINNGTGALTISTTSLTFFFAGTASTGNRTLATKGMATMVKVATDTWFISGVGLS